MLARDVGDTAGVQQEEKGKKDFPLFCSHNAFVSSSFFFHSSFWCLISGGMRASQIPSAFPSCPPLHCSISHPCFPLSALSVNHLDSLQRSSESDAQHGGEVEGTIKRTFMRHRLVGKNSSDWPNGLQPVVETASEEVKGTNEGRLVWTITVRGTQPQR